MLLDELIYNISILVALSLLSGFIDAHYSSKEIKGKILQGILFGLTAIIGMMHPYVLTEGIIFDGRSIVISLCALFFGPVSGLITSALSIIYRMYLGGSGILMGILVILSSLLIGIYFHYFYLKSNQKKITDFILYLFGLVVHIAMLIFVLALPTKNIIETYKIIAITVVGIFPVISLLIGKTLLSTVNINAYLKELKESETRYSRIVSAANEGIWVLDEKEKTNFINARLTELLGYTSDEMIGLTMSNFVHPDDLTDHHKQMKERRNGSKGYYDRRFLKKDKSIVWMTVSAVPMTDDSGKYSGSFGMLTDISKQKIIEEERSKIENLLSQSQELAKVGGWEWNVVENKMYWTEQCYRIHDIERNEIETSPTDHILKSLSCYSEKDRPTVMAAFENCLKNGVPYDLEFPFTTFKDRSIWIRTVAKAVLKNGKVVKVIGNIVDITDQKITEQSLKTSEERWQFALEGSNDGVWDWDLNTNEVYFSSRWKEMLGFSDTEFSNEFGAWENRIHPQDLEFVKDELQKYFRGELPNYNLEHRLLCKDGLYKYVLARGKVMKRNLDGSPARMVGTHKDITEQKQAEKELYENKEKFKQLFTSLHDGFALHEIILDENKNPIDYRFLEVNPAFENMTGLKANEIIGRTVKEIIPTLENYWIEIYGKVALTGTPIKFENYVPQLKKHYRIHAYSPSKNKFACITEDITEAKKSETKINQLSLVVEQSPVTVVITDTNGIIEYVNPKFTELTQYTFEEAIGKSPAILKTGNTSPEEYKIMWDTINSGSEWNGIFLNKKKDNKLFWESAKISPVRNSEGKIAHFVAIKEDITQRIETENELEEYRNSLESIVAQRTQEIDIINKELLSEIEIKKQTEILLQQSLEKEKELNKLKSRFISTASHEFRTPLTSILSSAELIQRYGKKWEEEKYQEHLNRITNSVEYLTELMDDVLTVSRIESGKIQLNPGKINLFEICSRVVEDFKLKKDFNHLLIFKYNTNVNEFYLDQKQIQIILQNLLSNAVKYSPDGSHIELTVEYHKREIQICITDEGIGIPDEDLQHLFEPFHRSLNTESIQGTGLGLSIVKNAVELHGGSIDVSSSLGRGTKFFITIPVNIQ